MFRRIIMPSYLVTVGPRETSVLVREDEGTKMEPSLHRESNPSLNDTKILHFSCALILICKYFMLL
jgi:hypothetical protein